jgi:hypothetical protein
MTEHRSTKSRRNAGAGLVAIRIGPRVYWVPSALARRIERLVSKAGRPIVGE